MFWSKNCSKVCTIFDLNYLRFATIQIYKNLEISVNNWTQIKGTVTIYELEVELTDLCKSICIRHCIVLRNRTKNILL